MGAWENNFGACRRVKGSKKWKEAVMGKFVYHSTSWREGYRESKGTEILLYK